MIKLSYVALAHERGTVALVGMLAGLPTLVVLGAGLPVTVLVITAALIGAGGSVFAVSWTTALQTEVPEEVLGRVMSLDYVGQLGLEPVGLAATAPVVAVLGITPVVAICAASLIITTALPFFVEGVCTFGAGDPARAADVD